MKHLFLVRPGEFNKEHDKLTSHGMYQMKELGESIKQIIGNSSVYIISSPANYAVDSAEELANNLNVPDGAVEVNPYFNNFDKEEWPRSYRHSTGIISLKSGLADSLIIVSNQNIIEALFCYMMNLELGKTGILGTQWPGTGEHIDLEKRVHQAIPKREW